MLNREWLVDQYIHVGCFVIDIIADFDSTNPHPAQHGAIHDSQSARKLCYGVSSALSFHPHSCHLSGSLILVNVRKWQFTPQLGNFAKKFDCRTGDPASCCGQQIMLS